MSAASTHFPKTEWPDKIELLYYSYHVMVGLGTIFIAVMALSVFLSGATSSLSRDGCSGSSC